uniref:Uncharacterized protein n=1 Tax=Anguilla anguilla TaxID=7936 RepID=A0A0E9SI47_ANGAN
MSQPGQCWKPPPYLSHFLCLKPVLCEVPIF